MVILPRISVRRARAIYPKKKFHSRPHGQFIRQALHKTAEVVHALSSSMARAIRAFALELIMKRIK